MLVALAGLPLAGCADDVPTAGVIMPLEQDGKYVIHLVSGNVFLPANASIPVGARVVWIADTGMHDVTEGRAGENGTWGSDLELAGKMTRGVRYERTFNETGLVEFRCLMHEGMGMMGTLNVTRSST
jgi:plastocyanin